MQKKSLPKALWEKGLPALNRGVSQKYVPKQLQMPSSISI